MIVGIYVCFGTILKTVSCSHNTAKILQVFTFVLVLSKKKKKKSYPHSAAMIAGIYRLRVGAVCRQSSVNTYDRLTSSSNMVPISLLKEVINCRQTSSLYRSPVSINSIISLTKNERKGTTNLSVSKGWQFNTSCNG